MDALECLQPPNSPELSGSAEMGNGTLLEDRGNLSKIFANASSKTGTLQDNACVLLGSVSNSLSVHRIDNEDQISA